jgi:pyrimidine-specific ribonucleoside hydrolase
LTSILLRTYPEAAAGLREIVFMGGTAGSGNATASAELNVWPDPEAAAIVLNAAGELDIPLTMYGLEVFCDVEITLAHARELIATREKSAVLAGNLIKIRCQLYGAEAATIGDGGAVGAAIEPDGLTIKAFPLRLELSGSWSRGRTIVDTRNWSGGTTSDPHGAAPTVVQVATAVDGRRYADLWPRTVR